MRRFLAIGLLVVAGAAAVVLSGQGGEDDVKTYYAQFDNAFGVVEGGDLRVSGVTAGQTVDLEVDDSGERPLARVELEITEPGFDSLRADATCEVRQQSLIGEYFVDCQPGSDRRELPDGATVPVEQTSSTIPTDVVNNVLRRPYRDRFRLILSELGTGLAGRPEDIQEVLKRAHPGLRETSRTLQILERQTETIQDFITDSDIVVAELEQRKQDVARWVEEAGQTAEISATRREQLATQFRRFPRFLDELEPTMVRLADLTDEQIPLLRDLRRAAPSLEAFLEELGPFSEASRPAFRSLGRAARVGNRALDRSQEEVETLSQLAEDAGPLGKSLRQFLQTLDTRARAINKDPRANDTDPPAPDPTNIPDGQRSGFTGFENIWNYFYWQPLAINAFDQLGHILRVIGFESHCAPYTTDPSAEDQHECASHLGPYQPGLHEAADGVVDPDPTDLNDDGIPDEFAGQFQPAEAPGAGSRDSDREAAGRGAQPRGGPEAKAKPGEPDPSQPQIVLPPSLNELVDRLTGLAQGNDAERRDGRAPAAPGGGAQQLLDFLLAP
ncbi:MAG: MlaD family protein [Thermoleophilaceae bacterium]